MRRQFRFFLAALALVLGLALPLATLAAPEVDFHNPVGLVNDFADVISPEMEAAIMQSARSLWEGNGVELAVVTVSSTAPYDTNTYAFRLFREWGIGESKKNNGLLVLLNMEERVVRIEVGAGLEGDITDAMTGRMLDKGMPALRDGNYGQGLLTITNELVSSVRDLDGQGKALFKFVPEVSGVGALAMLYIGAIIFAAIFRQYWLLELLVRLPFMLMRGGRGGGGFGGGGGGGFGGFGGGKSGGGGSSRKF